ncbi:MAG TPA: hypothetical protein VHL54_10910 [Actinomycetota bacterium]|nr:hypothetical protein [Actinomycetota bacterium]
MAGDRPKLTAVGAGEKPPRPPRSRSTIGFPYTDLGEAEHAAAQVADSWGQCRPEQLAAWLGHSTLKSGAFRNKVAAAKMFGVLEGSRNLIVLTGLGRRILENDTKRQARVEAFLSVPLFRAIFEAHRGDRIPGTLGLELEMVRLGVSRTQVQTARQVFVRSAELAGFFESGPKQLVLPRGTVFPPPSTPERPVAAASSKAAARYPKLIEAVLDQAPWDRSWTEGEFNAWASLLVSAARIHFKVAEPDQRPPASTAGRELGDGPATE